MSSGYKIDHKLKSIKSEDMIFHVHEYDINPNINHIYLMGTETYAEFNEDGEPYEEPGVEYTIANKFIRNLNICMRNNPDNAILVHMKSCGGDWSEGMAIYDAIKACPNPVTILNYTHARSMSSLILLAANKRVMMPNSYFMFHMGYTSHSGNYKEVESGIEFGKLQDKEMIRIYVDALKEQGKFNKWSKKRIEQMIKREMEKKEDVFLTSRQAVEWGFADEVFGDGENGYNWMNLVEYTDDQLER